MYLIKQECNEFNYRCIKYIDNKVFLRYGGKFYNHWNISKTPFMVDLSLLFTATHTWQHRFLHREEKGNKT